MTRRKRQETNNNDTKKMKKKNVGIGIYFLQRKIKIFQK